MLEADAGPGAPLHALCPCKRRTHPVSLSCDERNGDLYELLCMLWVCEVVIGILDNVHLVVLDELVKLECICVGDGLVVLPVYGQHLRLLNSSADCAHIKGSSLLHILSKPAHLTTVSAAG